MTELILTEQFVIIPCGEKGCDSRFAVPRSVYERWRETHEGWFCPAGHERYYPCKSDTEKLQAALKREEESKEYWQKDATRQSQLRRQVERRLSATQGVVTRIKRRVANGVCPCCKRHFVNLEKHMHGQHPNYVEGEIKS